MPPRDEPMIEYDYDDLHRRLLLQVLAEPLREPRVRRTVARARDDGPTAIAHPTATPTPTPTPTATAPATPEPPPRTTRWRHRRLAGLVAVTLAVAASGVWVWRGRTAGMRLTDAVDMIEHHANYTMENLRAVLVALYERVTAVVDDARDCGDPAVLTAVCDAVDDACLEPLVAQLSPGPEGRFEAVSARLRDSTPLTAAERDDLVADLHTAVQAIRVLGELGPDHAMYRDIALRRFEHQVVEVRRGR